MLAGQAPHATGRADLERRRRRSARRRGCGQRDHRRLGARSTAPVAWETACSTPSPTVSTASSSGSGARGDSATATSTRCCARSAWPCSKPTSTSRSCARSSARIREQSLGADLSKSLTPGAAGHQDRQRRARHRARRRDAPHRLRLEAADRRAAWRACRARARRPHRPSSPVGSSRKGATRCSSAPTCSARLLSSSCATLGRQIDVPVFSEPSDPVTVAGGGVAEAPTRRAATSSSSTPRVVSRSTAR